MRLVDDPDTAWWLEELAGPEGLEWDRGNRAKSEVKHGFAVADVESIYLRESGAVCRTHRRAGQQREAVLLLGVCADGRHAALVFTRRGEKLRPISCRAMRRKEKEQYDAAS